MKKERKNQQTAESQPIDKPSFLESEFSRRQTLINLSTLVAGTVFASSAYADLLKSLLGSSGKATLDRTLDPSSVFLPNASTTTGAAETFRLQANGLPNHQTGVFPNPGCPFNILPYIRIFDIPKAPKTNATPTDLHGWLFGVALNGVVFDPFGPYWNRNPRYGYQFEVNSTLVRKYMGVDFTNAHSQPSGEYHYHGRCLALQTILEDLIARRGEVRKMTLLGYAADGFPIYAPYGPKDAGDIRSPIVRLRSSYQLKSGTRPTSGPGRLVNAVTGERDYTIDGSFVQDYQYQAGSGELDECNGRTGVTEEYPQGTYYYVLTDEFPFVPRQWKGTPDKSFFHPWGGGNQDGVSGAEYAIELKRMFDEKKPL